MARNDYVLDLEVLYCERDNSERVVIVEQHLTMNKVGMSIDESYNGITIH